MRGSSEANILLTRCECNPYEEDCPAKDCDGYEIVIGAHNNTKSVIREHKQQIDSPDSFIDVSIYLLIKLLGNFLSPLFLDTKHFELHRMDIFHDLYENKRSGSYFDHRSSKFRLWNISEQNLEDRIHPL